MDNYPDYTWGGDPRAPWNMTDFPDCPIADCECRDDGYLEGCPLRYTCDVYAGEMGGFDAD